MEMVSQWRRFLNGDVLNGGYCFMKYLRRKMLLWSGL